MKSTRHAGKNHILATLAIGLLAALPVLAEFDMDDFVMPNDAAPALAMEQSANHPIEVWDEALQKTMSYRSREEQKALESLAPGLRVLLLSKVGIQVPACQKWVVIKHKDDATVEDTVYIKRGEDGKLYKRTDHRKIMKHFISKSTTLNLPGGATWILQGNVAIKFPDPQKEAFVQRAMDKAAEEQGKLAKNSSPEDMSYTYLCDIFSEEGRDYFRVVIIEPKVYQEIKNSLAGDAVKGVAGVVNGRASADARSKAVEMAKANTTQRTEYIIDKATLLPVSYAKYNSRGKRAALEEYKSIDKIEHLDDVFFQVPEGSKLIFPKSLMEFMRINGKHSEREHISAGKETNKK